MKLNKSILAIAVTTGLLSAQVAAEETGNTVKKDIEDVEVIEVRGGIRGSIINSQNLKRSAQGVVDIITSEDLGKFTDDNIGDAINRIPGVQLQRNNNGIGGDRASIRGLGPLFVNVTANGRSPLSHGDEGIQNLRQFNLDVIPSEIISGVVVRKTPSAETIEGGIGGSIELETLKPLSSSHLYKDDKNYFAAGAISAINDSLTEKTQPKFSGVFGFRNSANTFAGYVSAVVSDIDYSVDEAFTRANERDISIDTNGDGIADRVEEDVLSHTRISYNAIRGNKERSSIAYGLEWQPVDNLKIGFDGYKSTYDVLSQRPTADLFFDYSGVYDEDAITIENNYVQAVNPSAGYTGGGTFNIDTFDLLFNNLSENTVTGLNFVYGEGQNFTLKGDVSYSKVEFFQDLRLGIMNGGFASDDFNFDGTGDVPSFSYGEEVSDPDAYSSVGFFGRERAGNNEQLAFRLDAQWYVNDNLTLKAGLRVANTEVDVREASRFTYFGGDEALSAGLAEASFDGSSTESLFPGTGIDFDQLLVVDYDAQAAAYPDVFNERAASSTFNDSLLSVDSTTGLPLDRANSFVIEEDTTAFYVQADLEGELGERYYTANFGLRGVQTDRKIYGFQTTRVVNSVNGIVDELGFVNAQADSDDFQLLPSANFMLEVSDELQWRVGVSKTMSQPEYDNLKVNGSVDIQDINDVNYDPTINSTASIGNAELKPYTAWSFDTTFEYYTENEGAIYASFFYKAVDDFVLSEARTDVMLDGYDDQLFDTIQPINVSSGKIKGFELGTNMPITENFGIQANYTYVDSSFDNPGDNTLLQFGFPGASKNNFNTTAYYETDKFGARIAYVYRDDFFQALGGGVDRASQPAFTEGSGQVDLNFSYSVTDNIDVTLNVINATEEDSRNYIIDESNFRDYVTRSRSVIFGIRGSL
jgi:TonB-dependent receptor